MLKHTDVLILVERFIHSAAEPDYEGLAHALIMLDMPVPDIAQVLTDVREGVY